jgi:hypothetical protein
MRKVGVPDFLQQATAPTYTLPGQNTSEERGLSLRLNSALGWRTTNAFLPAFFEKNPLFVI